MTGRILCATALALISFSPALAQPTPSDVGCEHYVSWATPTPVRSAPAGYDVPVAQLMTGQASVVTLHQIDNVTFLAPPERHPDPGVHAGLLGFRAPVDGIYRVSVSEGVWIDLVKGDELVSAVAYGPPGCEGVSKRVEFDLKEGDYAIQLTGNPQTEITVMVSRVR